MREVIAKKYHELRASVGDPPPPTGVPSTEAEFPLPATFRDVAFRRERIGFSIKVFEARGVLGIGPDALEFVSEKERVSSPVKSIQSVDQPLLSAIKSALEASRRGPAPVTGPGDAAP